MKLAQNKFINPYNFIPLPSKKAKKYSDSDSHTGVIDYKITTKTPLFIPNTSSENAFMCGGNHKSYDFFSYHELELGKDYRNEYYEPVIPGSEIRGMVRSIYETLTDSCMSVFNDSIIPERRTGDIFLPALLQRKENGEYKLYQATGYRISGGFLDDDIKTNFHEGQEVYFDGKGYGISAKAENISAKKSSKKKVGYLIKGMPFQKKKIHCYIFELISEEIKCFKHKDLDCLKAIITSYQGQPQQLNFYVAYKEEYEKFIKGEGNEYFPVRYSLVQSSEGKEKKLYLSPAAITKEIAKTSLKEVLGELKACDHFTNCCPACDLFGMVGKDNESGIGSKIRFTDARITGVEKYKDCYDLPLVRETLGTPKLSNSEFYLVRPDGADYWTYDYYVKDGQIYFYSKKTPLKLRGRKFYCHQPNVKFPKNVAPSDLNATVRPLKEGITFRGKLYFENISEKQLKQLIWILGEREEENNICFKLGSGKPLGFGSVDLQITSCEERIISFDGEKINYQVNVLGNKPVSYEEVEFSPEVKNDFVSFMSYDYASTDEVSYPFVIYPSGKSTKIGTTVEKGFEWFQENNDNNKKIEKRVERKIKEPLPLISEKKYMDAYVKGENKKPEKNQKNHKPGTHFVEYKVGQKYDGVVTGYYDNGLKVTLKNGRYVKLYFRCINNVQASRYNLETVCPMNSKIKMLYKGKNEQGYDQWNGYLQ